MYVASTVPGLEKAIDRFITPSVGRLSPFLYSILDVRFGGALLLELGVEGVTLRRPGGMVAVPIRPTGVNNSRIACKHVKV